MHKKKIQKVLEDRAKEENHPYLDEIEDIVEFFKGDGIQCKKYNHSLDKESQKQSNYKAVIKLSNDGKELIIINRKPITRRITRVPDKKLKKLSQLQLEEFREQEWKDI